MATQPEYHKERYRCPHCGVAAKQEWQDCESLGRVAQTIQHQFFLNYRAGIESYQDQAIEAFLTSFAEEFPEVLEGYVPRELSLSSCHSCSKSAIWIEGQMVFPRTSPVDAPNADLNPNIAAIYNEAASIVSDSPKGAAALLRLALQMVMVQIGEDGKNINTDIKNLVAKGLSPKIQKALDLLRVAGNNAVHPGQISFDDDKGIALSMFKLLNLIAEEMITRPREIDELYEDVIPEETKKHIETRDGKSP
jgi:hypothetical protein